MVIINPATRVIVQPVVHRFRIQHQHPAAVNLVRVHVRFQMVQGLQLVRVRIQIHVMVIIPVRVVHRRARRVRDVRRGRVRPLVHVLGGHAMWRRVIQTTMRQHQRHVLR